MEVVHADWDDLEPTVRVLGQSSQSHDCDTSLERQKLCAIVATTLGEDTDTATIAQAGEDGLVDLGLIDMRCQLELGALVALSRPLHILIGKVAVFIDVVTARELLQSDLALKRSLDTDFFGTENLRNIDAGAALVLGRRKEKHTLNLALTLSESGANTTY
ncbi:hypothetical protein HG530_002078 [Fusarium avenaceum]|nr:hypothetical protein HG530_002078 [Fusarium avenaceum]